MAFCNPGRYAMDAGLNCSRINAFNASMYRKPELNNTVFSRSNSIFINMLQGRHLPRAALKQGLEKKKISMHGFRFIYLLMRAELDGVICSGIRDGRQFTYALLGERAPATKKLPPEEALAELSTRYFCSRAPATLQDFVWWSGLTVKDAKEGVASLSVNFTQEHWRGHNYIFLSANPVFSKGQNTFLMPDYDEYEISYKNRAAISPEHVKGLPGINPVFKHLVIVNGRIAGTWQRTIKKNGVAVHTHLHTALSGQK